MTNVSTARKLSVIARVAAQRAGRTRTGGALLQGITAAAGHVLRTLRQLWHEVTGFVFLALATIGGFALAREYGKYAAGAGSRGRLAVAIIFTLTFVWFGVSSFWHAWKKS